MRVLPRLTQSQMRLRFKFASLTTVRPPWTGPRPRAVSVTCPFNARVAVITRTNVWPQELVITLNCNAKHAVQLEQAQTVKVLLLPSPNQTWLQRIVSPLVPKSPALEVPNQSCVEVVNTITFALRRELVLTKKTAACCPILLHPQLMHLRLHRHLRLRHRLLQHHSQLQLQTLHQHPLHLLLPVLSCPPLALAVPHLSLSSANSATSPATTTISAKPRLPTPRSRAVNAS
jgi:hypothetical protein